MESPATLMTDDRWLGARDAWKHAREAHLSGNHKLGDELHLSLGQIMGFNMDEQRGTDADGQVQRPAR